MAAVGTAVGLQQNGVSTTKERDVLRYDCYSGYQGKSRVQWDYRDRQGKLHTAITNDINLARVQAARYGYLQGMSREERI